MARKSQVKAIASRAKQLPVVQPVPKDESPSVASATLSRAAKKKHVKRAKSLTKSAPSPLAVRMQQDLQLTGRGEATQNSYLRAVRKLAVFACKSPDLIDEEELRAYFYYIRNDQLWEPSTIRVAYSNGRGRFIQQRLTNRSAIPQHHPWRIKSSNISVRPALASASKPPKRRIQYPVVAPTR